MHKCKQTLFEDSYNLGYQWENKQEKPISFFLILYFLVIFDFLVHEQTFFLFSRVLMLDEFLQFFHKTVGFLSPFEKE